MAASASPLVLVMLIALSIVDIRFALVALGSLGKLKPGARQTKAAKASSARSGSTAAGRELLQSFQDLKRTASAPAGSRPSAADIGSLHAGWRLEKSTLLPTTVSSASMSSSSSSVSFATGSSASTSSGVSSLDSIQDFSHGRINVAHSEDGAHPFVMREKGLLTQIGEGSFGKVFKGVDPVTKAMKAYKFMDITDTQDAQRARMEYDAAVKLRESVHVMVGEAIHCKAGEVCMEMPYCANGDLMAYFEDRQSALEHTRRSRFSPRSRKSGLPVVEALGLARQMALGLKDAHDKDLCHMDVKLANFLLVGKPRFIREKGRDKVMFQDGSVRLSDFGMVVADSEPAQIKDKWVGGTEPYMAPEVRRVWDRRSEICCAAGGPYGKAADIWSLGICLYCLLCGELPPDQFYCSSEHKHSCTVPFDSDAWKGVPVAVKTLLRQMLNVDPERRPTAAELIAHPLLSVEHCVSGVECSWY